MARRRGPSVRKRRLGLELRGLRDAAGMNLDEAAQLYGCSRATMARIESADSSVSSDEVATLLDIYRVGEDDPKRQTLLIMARQARKRGWWRTYGDAVSDPYADYISLENDATAIRVWESQLVPGLFQTEEYTREVITAVRPMDSREDIDGYVAVKAARQKFVAQQPRQPRICAVVWEPVLRQHVGTPKLMAAQCQRLLEEGERPNVEIQVLPLAAGAHAAMESTFTILAYDGPNLDVVCIDNATSSLYLEEDREVEHYGVLWERLLTAALDTRSSARLIRQIAKEWST